MINEKGWELQTKLTYQSEIRIWEKKAVYLIGFIIKSVITFQFRCSFSVTRKKILLGIPISDTYFSRVVPLVNAFLVIVQQQPVQYKSLVDAKAGKNWLEEKKKEFVCSGQLLREDSRTLASYGLRDGCVVHCHISNTPYSTQVSLWSQVMSINFSHFHLRISRVHLLLSQWPPLLK